jgi:5-(carboxyamino)imidazole ribonucleotide synthase
VTTRVINPGCTIGVLGGGQLGRMFAMAARRLGYRVHTLAPDHDTPTGQIADVEVVSSYDDVDRVREFARAVDVVTFEFENVPAAAAAAAAEVALVRPGGHALEVAQHRIREKAFLSSRGLPVAPYREIRTESDLVDGICRIGRPAVLKTAALGYDGKGQVAIGDTTDALEAWETLGRREAILESFVDLEREISIIATRGADGDLAFFDPFENTHVRHILDLTLSPAALPIAMAGEAVDITRSVLEGLEYIGIVCIEFFVSRQGRLIVNEIAPRPHNSGHLTCDACRTSQFEQQLRAICGLPLGAPDLLRPAAMANLLGDLWRGGEPDWAAALALRDIKLHLYGKATPRHGRKMGHLTALAGTPERARDRVLLARTALGSRAS